MQLGVYQSFISRELKRNISKRLSCYTKQLKGEQDRFPIQL